MWKKIWRKIKNTEPEILANIAFSFALIVIGIILMSYPAFGLINPVYYISLVFYAISFFSVITYFLERREGYYEMLFLSLTNILIATFMFVFQNRTAPFIFGTAMLLYTTFNLLNKGFYTYKYKKDNNYMWAFKLVSFVLIFLIGLLTTINLYTQISVITLMFGYYFITYGLIFLIEPLFALGIESGYLKKLVKEISKGKAK